MPTFLSDRPPGPRPKPPPEPRDPGIRDVMVAGVFLLMVLGLLVEQRLPPTPGYSLATSPDQIQLSP